MGFLFLAVPAMAEEWATFVGRGPLAGNSAPTKTNEKGDAHMNTLALRAQVAPTFALAAMAACAGLAQAQVTIRQAAGPTAASIQATVDQYRADLGTLNPNNPGSQGSGRREINWDGVPEGSSAPNNLAADFFNGPASPRARGAVFSTTGTGFQVSANAVNSTNTPVNFANINPSYLTEFAPFSTQKLFTSLGSNVMDITWFVPGSNTPAIVSGFGVVFSDVDLTNSTRVEFYNASGGLILTACVPAAGVGSHSFSFLGAFWPTPQVSRCRIISGTAAVGATTNDQPTDSGSPTDVVVMDDFIYGEPVAIPAGPCRVDFNEDGYVNVQDFLSFLGAYAAGCP
jgi:hypothetical protein